MAFASETFSYTAGTTLQSNNAAFVLQTGYTLSPVISSAGRLRGSGAGNFVVRNTTAPASADYSVFSDLVVLLEDGTNAGVTGRASASAQTFYMARLVTGTGWQLYKFIAEAATQLGSTSVETGIAAGTTKRLELRMAGTTISLYVDGVLKITVPDASITAAGFSGIYTNSGEDTTGIHIDNWSAVDAGGSTVNLAASGSAVSSGSATVTSGSTTGTFVIGAMENNTGNGALNNIAVNWTWFGGVVGSVTSITNGSGTITTGGMTLTGLPAGVGFAVLRSDDGTVVAYREGTAA